MQRPAGEVEVLYVDSASNDDSIERARKEGVRTIELRSDRPCAAIARNVGWKEARSQLVLFLDADTELAPDFVVTSTDVFEDPSIAVVYGHQRERDPRSSVFTRVLDLDSVEPTGLTDFCGGDALMRRAALLELGGFDESLIAGEEPELCRRLKSRGWKVVHTDATMSYHEFGITRLSQYCRHAIRTGYAYAEVSERFRATESPLWSAEARHNRINGTAILGLIFGSLLLTLILRSPLPILVATIMMVVLSLRTAFRNRWKSSDMVTLFLYGLHSHLQHIPILWGQITYRWRRWRGIPSRLIEYKTSAPSQL